MKLVAFSLLLAVLHLGVPVYSQKSLPHISLSVKNASLKSVLDSIEKKTGYIAFGDAAWMRVAKSVTISVQDFGLKEALDLCFANQPLIYQLVGYTITIRLKGLKDASVGGRLINARKEPVPGATIQVKGSKEFVQSNDNGEFSVPINGTEATLIIGSINYEKAELKLIVGKDSVVQLKERIIALNSVSVLHTGYQNIPRERATGSFVLVDNALVNRSTSTNILERLNGVTSGLLFNKNGIFGTNQSGFTVRGRSTIFANPEPLIVVDNFPYTGDIYNINPDDVENITVLKDAAAASIWGAFSGNGVIVITTKKGKFNQAPRVSFNTSLTFGNRPDVYYTPILSPSELVDVEQNLFDSSFYSGSISNSNPFAVAPVAEILQAQKDGKLSAEDANNELNLLKRQDIRRDLRHYFYRPGLNQQYSINVCGGGVANQYFLSAGYDKDISSLVRNSYNRVTLTGNNTYILLPQKLELSSGFNFASSKTTSNNNAPINYSYPYLNLAALNGKALAVPNQYRQPYIDTAGGGQLLDWNYRPLDDLNNADNVTKLIDYRINIGLRYVIFKDLDMHAYYQFWKASSDFQNFQSQQMYITRNLINSFTQLGSGMPVRPVPLGGILDEIDSSYQANNIRLQLNYDHYFDPNQSVTVIAGTEIRDIEGRVRTSRLYGYDKDLSSSQPVDYNTYFPQYLFPFEALQIPNPNQDITTSDRYLSYYFDGSYHLMQRYVFSASARKDESNIFGVKTNQKGIPLWSAGGAWEISREAFYNADQWLPYLKLRLTDGYNGNVDKSVSAYTTASVNPYNSSYGTTTASIINPPNPFLQWEKIHIVNVGLDFATRNNLIEGSLEYYFKKGEGLIAPSTLDPTTGVSGTIQFTGNTAAMTTHGIDITIRTKKDFGWLRWSTVFLFSYAKDKVTTYKQTQSTILDYFNASFINPLEGRPLYSVYALKWMGLDPLDGDPQGWLNGAISKDYTSIANSSNFADLLYIGPSSPPIFGSFRNSFAWKRIDISFNIVYKLGYYFRRNSVDYTDLFDGHSPGHPDFDKRWMKPGDEKITNVPSLDYSGDQSRDLFYAFSEPLVEKGDHIRLQDIRISYDLQKQFLTKVPLQWVQVYFYANNIGILWRANHQGIDPDALPGIMNYPNPRSLTLGLKLGL